MSIALAPGCNPKGIDLPDNFGEINGTPISNKDTILDEIDKTLSMNKHPSVEYLITMPFGLFNLPWNLGSINYNSFGHSALRYITPDGKDVVVNVEAKESGEQFIKIYEASEYLYGTDPRKSGAQRGVYNRNVVGLRVENVKKEHMDQLHKYVCELEQNANNKYRFNILFGPVFNLYQLVNPTAPEYGNCARWTSLILQKAGLVPKIYVWPKTVFIGMFENYAKTNISEQSNMNVVYYSQPTHVKTLAYGVRSNKVLFDGIAPFQTIRNFFYRNLEHFANCKVEITEGTIEAKPWLVPNPAKPSKLRDSLNSKYVIVGSLICSGLFYRFGYKKLTKYLSNYKLY